MNSSPTGKPSHPPDKPAIDLLASQVLLFSVLENLPDMIFIKDAQALRFVFMNSAGARLLGIAQEDLIGKTDFDFFPSEQADYFVYRDRQTLNTGVMQDIPLEPIRTSSGETRFLHTKKIPLRDAEGRPSFLVGISRDITDEIRMEREIIEIASIEQERIAHDLHDSLGQTLTSLALKAQVLKQDIECGNPSPPLLAHQIVWLANHASEQARAIARGMDPVVLEHGLIAALRDLSTSTQEMFSLNCRLNVSAPAALMIDKRTSSHLYRIVQEAVTNSVRHGRPKSIDIEVLAREEGLRISVTDDGSGISLPVDPENGSGIRNMTYRARLIGAQLEIQGKTEGGTTVVCTLSRPLTTAGTP